MFGFSLTKLLFTVAVILIIWYGFKWLGRIQEQGDKRDRERLKGTEAGARGDPDAETMIKCPTCSAYVAILQTPISFVLALFVWTTPSPVQLAWLAGVGVLVAVGHITMVQAIRYVDVSSLEPFVFMRLIWAALIGYLAFSEFPGIWTWAGAAVIVAATTYILRREAKLHRGRYPPAPDDLII